MKHVQPGDQLAINANVWNFVVGQYERANANGSVAARGFQQSTTCLVRNDTGDDLPRFGVVGLANPLIPPDINEDSFLQGIAFEGRVATLPGYDLAWGICPQSIQKDEIGLVIVQGLAICKISMDADQPITGAGPLSSGNVNYLVSEDCGLARVLYRAAGHGPQWAIVCLG